MNCHQTCIKGDCTLKCGSRVQSCTQNCIKGPCTRSTSNSGWCLSKGYGILLIAPFLANLFNFLEKL
jgi:hypothetical protein